MTCSRCAPRRVIVSSQSYDDYGTIVGTSPVRGERLRTGVLLPPEPTPTQERRYLVMLGGLAVPSGGIATLRSLRQMLTVGWLRPAQARDERDPVEGITVPIELPFDRLLGPFARFIDGNVSWHLRKLPPTGMPQAVPSGYPPSWNRNFNDLSAGVRYSTLPPSKGGLDAYRPANNGLPPGEPIAPFGEWHDVRYPWEGQSGTLPNLRIRVEGPCQIHWYASVAQTDPDTRPQPLPAVQLVADYTSLLSEGIEKARYWAIGGEMAWDIRGGTEPDCEVCSRLPAAHQRPSELEHDPGERPERRER